MCPLNSSTDRGGRLAVVVRRLTLALLLVAGSGGVSAEERTLYDDLGGLEGISDMVDGFLFRIADDEKINHFFIETDIMYFRERLIEHICVRSEGPCDYQGDSMARTHANMGVDDAAFNRVVEHFIVVMEELNIPTGVQNRFLKGQAIFYPEVVEHD